MIEAGSTFATNECDEWYYNDQKGQRQGPFTFSKVGIFLKNRQNSKSNPLLYSFR